MKKILLVLAALLGLTATPAYSATTTPVSVPADLRPDLVPEIVCGYAGGTAWALTDHIIVTAYHVTSFATVSCTLPATHETAYIISEDKTADIAYLYVEKPRTWHFTVDCNGYRKGETYYAAGWPKEGFKVSQLTASGDLFRKTGFWWDQELFYGPQQTEHGQSGGPTVNILGVVVGLVNGGNDAGMSTSRALADTAICRRPVG